MIRWFKERYMSEFYPFPNQKIWLRPIQDIYLKLYILYHKIKWRNYYNDKD